MIINVIQEWIVPQLVFGTPMCDKQYMIAKNQWLVKCKS